MSRLSEGMGHNVIGKPPRLSLVATTPSGKKSVLDVLRQDRSKPRFIRQAKKISKKIRSGRINDIIKGMESKYHYDFTDTSSRARTPEAMFKVIMESDENVSISSGEVIFKVGAGDSNRRGSRSSSSSTATVGSSSSGSSLFSDMIKVENDSEAADEFVDRATDILAKHSGDIKLDDLVNTMTRDYPGDYRFTSSDRDLNNRITRRLLEKQPGIYARGTGSDIHIVSSSLGGFGGRGVPSTTEESEEEAERRSLNEKFLEEEAKKRGETESAAKKRQEEARAEAAEAERKRLEEEAITQTIFKTTHHDTRLVDKYDVEIKPGDRVKDNAGQIGTVTVIDETATPYTTAKITFKDSSGRETVMDITADESEDHEFKRIPQFVQPIDSSGKAVVVGDIVKLPDGGTAEVTVVDEETSKVTIEKLIDVEGNEPKEPVVVGFNTSTSEIQEGGRLRNYPKEGVAQVNYPIDMEKKYADNFIFREYDYIHDPNEPDGIKRDSLGRRDIKADSEGKLIYREKPVLFFDWHNDLPELEKAYQRNQNAMIIGPAGSGKSQIGNRFANLKGLPVWRVSCSRGTQVEDLLGGDQIVRDPTSGLSITRFVKGPVPESMEAGGILILDEVNSMQGEIMASLNAALDLDNRKVYLGSAEKGAGWVKASPTWFVIATVNPPGGAQREESTSKLPNRMRTRFTMLTQGYPSKDVEMKIVLDNLRRGVNPKNGKTYAPYGVTKKQRDVIKVAIDAVDKLRKQYEKGDSDYITSEPSIRQTVDFAKMIVDGESPRTALDKAIVNQYAEEGEDTLKSIRSDLGTILSSMGS